MKKLTEEDLQRYESADRTFARECALVNTRVDYIIKKIYKTFGANVSCWHWMHPYDSRTEGRLEDHFNLRVTSVSGFYVESSGTDEEMIIITGDGGEYELYEFPSRWLTEDFEKELVSGRIKYLDKYSTAKIEKEDKKYRKKKKAALAKLTKEEIKILGIK